jgi:hypothetical protein
MTQLFPASRYTQFIVSAYNVTEPENNQQAKLWLIWRSEAATFQWYTEPPHCVNIMPKEKYMERRFKRKMKNKDAESQNAWKQ